jgi:hypothetical protein
LVIDVGQLYQNRAEVQSGADAAALAVAKTCALGACNTSVATTYAGDNSHTGKSAVDTVCGSGTLSPCSLGSGSLTQCPANPAGNYVDVATTAETSGGSTLVPPAFANALAGNGSYQGSTVNACSQVEWGTPASTATIGFTISACSWDSYTANGTNFGQPPPFPPDTEPPSSYDQVLTLGGGSGGGCTGEGSNADGAGIFGWTTSSGCSVTISAGSTYTATTGVSGANACLTTIQTAYTNKSVVYLPVYTTLVNSTYTLKGFAAFVITGYSKLTTGQSASDWLNPSNSNNCSFKCIDGYFTQAIIPATGSFGTTPNLGASVVELSS